MGEVWAGDLYLRYKDTHLEVISLSGECQTMRLASKCRQKREKAQTAPGSPMSEAGQTRRNQQRRLRVNTEKSRRNLRGWRQEPTERGCATFRIAGRPSTRGLRLDHGT